MFIKRLEIFGFKSFKNKTVLQFDNQEIAGIVGPNGCGKSNLLDAFLWIMGENSPRHLRGDSMSDVIFSGTEKEAPGNLAEVTLTLGKGRSDFPEAYKKFSEIMICRRSFRDGKTECFINQQACLLRDIREIFMNTGAGCRGFSIIEQADIEKLITAKPSQRRFLIEEAAGITKFKNRRGESIRKLELVHQNLQRLDDILKMQETQLNQLNQQAKKAERYKRLKQEIDSREKEISAREQEGVFSAFQNLKQEQDSLKEKISQAEKEILLWEKQTAEEKDQLNITEKKLKELTADKEALKQEEMKMAIEEASLQDKAKAFDLIQDIQRKKQNLKEKEQAMCKALDQIQKCRKTKKEQNKIEQSAFQLENQIQEIQKNKIEMEGQKILLQKQMDFIEKEKAFLWEEKKNLRLKIQKNLREKNKLISFLEEQKQLHLNLNKNKASVFEQINSLEDKKKSRTVELDRLIQNVSVLQHKCQEMKKLVSRFSSANEGASDLIQWKPEEYQPLFQNLKVDPDYALALDSVLGHHIHALIPTEDILGIEHGVQRLKNQRKGRASFLSSLSGEEVSPTLKQEIRSYPAFICFLSEKLKWKIPHQSLQFVLGQTVVVSDFPSAVQLKKQFPAFQYVTQEGDLITRDSFVYAGSSDKEGSLFQIHTQIDELEKQISSQKMLLKTKTVNLESCTKQLEKVQKRKQSIQKEDHLQSKSLISAKKDIEHLEKDISHLLDLQEKNEQRIKDFRAEKQNLVQHEKANGKELQHLEKSLTIAKSRLHTLQFDIDEQKRQEMERSKKERELSDNKNSQQHLDQEIELLFRLIHKPLDLEKTKNNPSSLKEAALSLSDLQKQIQLFQSQKQKTKEREDYVQKELAQHEREKSKGEKQVQDLESRILQAKWDIQSGNSEWDKKELEKTFLKNKFLENYHIKLEDFTPFFSKEISLEKLKQEIENYKKQLDQIKELNFVALEEHGNLSKKNFFLKEQKEDLIHSKKTILKVISHIDKMCDSRFQKMLEEVNQRFSKVFPIVFQGGGEAKARLILQAEPEGGEPGLDIIVQPPGKRSQSVSLLSRGEKALSAICLIYSLFLVKPVPFCIIDEADAPLDDANTFRFISVLKEMARHSQMIVITHNKYSMQACRKLYGVTMERPGISQIVSVDMQEPELSSFTGDPSIN